MEIHTHANLTAIVPVEPGLVNYLLTLPLHAPSLTQSHYVLLRQEKGRQ